MENIIIQNIQGSYDTVKMNMNNMAHVKNILIFRVGKFYLLLFHKAYFYLLRIHSNLKGIFQNNAELNQIF